MVYVQYLCVLFLYAATGVLGLMLLITPKGLMFAPEMITITVSLCVCLVLGWALQRLWG